jgi:hypothetical protein
MCAPYRRRSSRIPGSTISGANGSDDASAVGASVPSSKSPGPRAE